MKYLLWCVVMWKETGRLEDVVELPSMPFQASHLQPAGLQLQDKGLREAA